MEAGVSVRRSSVLALFTTLFLVAVSCSDHESPTSPGSSAPAGKATISGTLLAAGDAPAGRGAAGAGEPLANVTVRVASTGQAAQTDSAGHFTLAGVPAGIVNLEIRGAGVQASATVAASPGAVTKVTVTVDRKHSTVKLDPRSDGLQGTVNNLTSPSFTLKTERGMVTVMTDGNTQFRRGGSSAGFGDLKIGQRVEVEGSPQPNGSILASRVSLEEEGDQEEATRTPTPTVTGTPPTATATRTPKPDDDEDRTKTPTVTGTPPTATATRTPEPEDDDKTKTPTPTPAMTGGSPTPTRTPEPGEGIEVEGMVGMITGTNFALMTGSGTVMIQTSGSTQFRRGDNMGSFADIKTGEEVEVRGQIQPDKSVLASRVDIKGD